MGHCGAVPVTSSRPGRWHRQQGLASALQEGLIFTLSQPGTAAAAVLRKGAGCVCQWDADCSWLGMLEHPGEVRMWKSP